MYVYIFQPERIDIFVSLHTKRKICCDTHKKRLCEAVQMSNTTFFVDKKKKKENYYADTPVIWSYVEWQTKYHLGPEKAGLNTGILLY